MRDNKPFILIKYIFSLVVPLDGDVYHLAVDVCVCGWLLFQPLSVGDGMLGGLLRYHWSI